MLLCVFALTFSKPDKGENFQRTKNGFKMWQNILKKLKMINSSKNLLYNKMVEPKITVKISRQKPKSGLKWSDCILSHSGLS